MDLFNTNVRAIVTFQSKDNHGQGRYSMEHIIGLLVLLAIVAAAFVAVVWTVKLAQRIPEVKEVSLDFTSLLLPRFHR